MRITVSELNYEKPLVWIQILAGGSGGQEVSSSESHQCVKHVSVLQASLA
jgi:hypothetical protein